MDQTILQPARNCQGIYDVGRTDVLIDGRNYFRAFYDAARQARQYILMAGWQFERSAPLLRGRDAEEAGSTMVVSEFLNALCEKNPELRIYILMWDFSPLVALDKEWFNKLVLDLTSSDRIHFRFDSSHALYASHHQKLVVIDGSSAFVGGLDISANSWDDRMHWAENAQRVLDGEEYEPYHDVQTFNTGAVAWELTRLFQQRWVLAGGAMPDLPRPVEESAIRVRKAFRLQATRAAVSTTRAQTLLPLVEPVMQIRQLYLDAIEAAEKLIYIETQYFTSQAVFHAIRKRMLDPGRPCPQIVLILPKRFHTFIEDLSLSVLQAKMLRSLAEIAEQRRCSFGVYYTAAALSPETQEKPTYIHSKVLVVDDRFLSIGSANMTNRSMGMDTELNLSWEAPDGDGKGLVRSIRRVRATLLAEHTGLRKLSERKALGSWEGLVDYLNSRADRQGCRLRRHTMKSFLDDEWIRDLEPGELSIDPERPFFEETVYEMISRDRNSIFSKGILLLNQLALTEPPPQEEGQMLSRTETPKRSPFGNKGHLVWYILLSIGLGIVVALFFVLGR